jgi:iron complex transport system substrate-binding protein
VLVVTAAAGADWLWRIGAWDQVVGVTAYFQAPSDAPARPRLSGFSTARLDEIEALEPDLVIGFSDVQAGLLAELGRRGLSVWLTNPRRLPEIESVLECLGRIVDRAEASARQLDEFRCRLAPVVPRGRRPRVYFEEWPEPMVTGIGWVSELIERAGGDDVFADRRHHRAAAQRQITAGEVIAAQPEIVVASWCGRRFERSSLEARAGWQALPAVRSGRVYELDSDDILQPGFRLALGYERLCRWIRGEA